METKEDYISGWSFIVRNAMFVVSNALVLEIEQYRQQK